VIELVLTFVLVSLATAFVCTAVKEDEDQHLAMSSTRLFLVMAGGIAAFAFAVQVLTLLAG
jgi:hypothetical protein